MSLLRKTEANRIVSDGLVGFVEAKLQFRIDVSDRELYLGFSHGAPSLVHLLLNSPTVREGNTLLLLGYDVMKQFLRRAARNADGTARATVLSWLLSSNSLLPCTEGLLLALSCGREDLACEWMEAVLSSQRECGVLAELHASPEMVVELTKRVATKARGNDTTAAAARQAGTVIHVSRQCNQCGQSKEAMELCNGCRSAWYCGAECHLLHWPTHKASCNACLQCGMWLVKILRCSRCQKAKYCSVQCSKAHWGQHKADCSTSTKKL